MMRAATKGFVERAERRPVSLRGFALGPSRDSDVVLTNLSYDGCEVSSADRFRRGEKLELRLLRHGAIQAEVRWSAQGRAGMRFAGSETAD